jgi:hypothetical protein
MRERREELVRHQAAEMGAGQVAHLARRHEREVGVEGGDAARGGDDLGP